jgi:hypothetical protein
VAPFAGNVLHKWLVSGLSPHHLHPHTQTHTHTHPRARSRSPSLVIFPLCSCITDAITPRHVRQME